MSQENNFVPEQENYKPLSPFKLFVKSNFPFIEATYEALDNYGLYCKVVEYLNNVIANENTIENNMTSLYNAFVSLNTYVSNYFDNLDVQEEINNRLDTYAQDGTLANLLGVYVDPKLQVIRNNINTMQNEINSVASGSPAGVYDNIGALELDNPDHSKIYVVIDTGEWYFYDNSNETWTSGGTYQATEDSETLSLLDEKINNIINIQYNYLTSKSYIDGKVYDINNRGFDTTANANLSVITPFKIKAGVTYYYRNLWAYFCKIIYNDNTVVRLDDDTNTRNGSFTPTKDGQIGISYVTSMRDKLGVLFTESIDLYNSYTFNDKGITDNIIIDNYESVIKDNNKYFNIRENLLENVAYIDNKIYGRDSWIASDSESSGVLDYVYLEPNTTYYYRNIWAYFSRIRYSDDTYQNITSNTDGLYSGSFTTANNPCYIAITLNRAALGSSSSNPLGINRYLLTKSKEMYLDNVYHSQYFNHIYHVDKVNGDFTTLSDALKEATKYMDSVIYLGKGEYNIIEELGETYFENASPTQRGLYLKNRVKLICSSDSKISLNYNDGNRENVNQWISVFNAGQHGYTLENATIEGKNIRYIIHDERDQDSDQYTNTYKNCKMYMDNSENQNWGGNNCIGGGLGRNGHIIINNCYFEAKPREIEPQGDYGKHGIVTYHNCASLALNRINISSSYVANEGSMRFTWYGSSIDKSLVMVNNCNLGAPITFRAETDNQSSENENLELIEWNNIIRN